MHTESLEPIACWAARRLGVADHRPLVMRTAAAAGVALCRQTTAVVQACLPKLSLGSFRLVVAPAMSAPKRPERLTGSLGESRSWVQT